MKKSNKRILYKKGLLLKNYIFFFLVLITAPAVWSQDLTLNVGKTDELCPGNGSLQFSVENADPVAPINYKVYKLPNITIPISDNSNTSVSGLIAGDYLVIATQVVNSTPRTDQKEVTIDDLTIPLTYTITSDNAYCGPDGKITVNVVTGIAATYEIMTGPATKPAQTSNIFNNIPAGTYQVRVTDNCGSAEVTTHILFSDGPILAIDLPQFPDLILPACDQITVKNGLSSTNDVDITYPLSATFTVYPPGGGDPLVYNMMVTGGDAQAAEASYVIPFYYDTPYYYDLVVVDPCGTVYTLENNLVDQHLNAMPGFDDLGCGKKAFMINLSKYIPPYTVTFTSVPPGFDPEVMNADHPGPFNDPIIYYGDLEDPVPAGIYAYSVTDSCGHTSSNETELVIPEVEPIAAVFNADCLGNPGRVEVTIPGYIIGVANFTVAPPAYVEDNGGETPIDVSEFITEDEGLKVSDLPPGEYTVVLIDTCGTEWPPVNFEILQSPGNVGAPISRPDCTPGRSSVYMTAAGGVITMVKITAAPAEFTEPLPYDATFNISAVDGAFYMDNLPPGPYSFLLDTTCETGVTKNATLTAYNVTVNDFEMTRHCGSFDIWFQHTGNAVAFLSYWLQKYDPVTDTWGHPDTGVPDPGGNSPVDVENGLQLTNNATVYNLIHTGQFRIVKIFQTFPSGSVSTKKYCMEVLHEFEFLDDLQIIGIMSLTCSGAIGDVLVDVEGVSPLLFEIISKNGDDTFYINNGENNIFNALDTAVYKIRVADPCGNYKAEIFNVADLPSLVDATKPDDLDLCDTDNNGTGMFDLSQQDSTILNGQDAALVSLTYHASQEDADNGNSPLPNMLESGTATIYARLIYDNNTACIATTYFDINVHGTPELQMDGIWTGCEGEEIEIVADAGYDSYLWSNGQTTQSITVSEGGTHTVKVVTEYGCEGEKTVQVAFSPLPVIDHIDITDWTDSNNVITVIMEDPSLTANFEYSLDGIHYQDSNVFSGLSAGPYMVYVRDKFKCGRVFLPVFLLTYPKFFTPNGDGVNETWRIQFSIKEPDMLVYIYDRYGKLITGFGTDSIGWDGTLNGQPLPSTDYWFIVRRQNGKEYKGHFSMIR
jgi:gliding motility-associated-like protein